MSTMSENKHDDYNEPKDAPGPSVRLRALVLICLGIMVIAALAYLPNLSDDSQRTAALFGMLCIFNAVVLVMNVYYVEASNRSWRDVIDERVSAAISSFGNVLFIGGLALWFAYKDLGLSNIFCYFVALMGVSAHAVLHYLRWRIKPSNVDALLTTVYAVMAATIATAIIGAAFFHDLAF